MRPRLVITLLLCLGVPPLAGAEPGGGKHALLIGCTRYPSLADRFQLHGPANDVLLLRDLLTGRFGFPKDHVTILAEAEGEQNRPTRSHIAREFARLAQAVKPGDQVVILMAGHGSQQPEQNPDDPDDFEPDGLDEIFLPADVGPWEDGPGQVRNAIVDNDIRGWLKAIQDRGAAVWVIVDTCHSATMVRGADEEVLRDVPAEVLVPAAALERARAKAAARAGTTRGGERSRGAGPAGDERLRAVARKPGLVALYASQSTEPTVETKLPYGSPARKPYGLLTYTICQILSQSDRPLTYAELVYRVHAQYVARGRVSPTPLVEGKDRDREVLGLRSWPGRSRFQLIDADEGLKVNAGALHGLTAGSVLAVYPPVGQPGADQVKGYVRVSRDVLPHEARVEPCAFGKAPLVKDLKEGRCEPVFIDYGDQRLKVAVDHLDSLGRPAPADAVKTLAEELTKLSSGPRALFAVVPEPKDAAWLVRHDRGGVYLVPASGWPLSDKSGRLPPLFGPAPSGDGLGPWLEDRLSRIARVQNLLRVSGETAGAGGDEGVKVEVEMRRFRDRADKTGELVPWQTSGLALRGGERVGFRVRNRSQFAVDVTILFVDSGYGIEAFYPDPGKGDINRLYADEATPLLRGQINDRTRGLEHVVVIAVKARGPAVDFTALAQPTLERAQAAERTRGNAGLSLGSPLGRLLQHSLYGQGGTRGMSRDEVSDYATRVISWKTLTREDPPSEK